MMLKTLIADLEALRLGRLSPQQFRQRHPMTDASGGQLEGILSSIEHYLSDGDIRTRDADYARMQNKELEELIGHLRAGRLDLAMQITFLRRT